MVSINNHAPLPIFAKLLADSANVELSIGGTEAKTNIKKVWLPDLPHDDQNAKFVAYGYICHETGHIKHTSFAALYGWETDAYGTIPDYIREAMRRPIVKELVNVLEDIRVEYLEIHRYPGAKILLQNVCSVLQKDIDIDTCTNNPANCLICYISSVLRSKVLHQSGFETLVATSWEKCNTYFPEQFLRRLNQQLLQVVTAKTTEELVDLALQIVQIMEDESGSQSQSASQQPGDSSSEGKGLSQPQASQANDSSIVSEGQSKPEASKSDDSSSAGEGQSQSQANKTDGASAAGEGQSKPEASKSDDSSTAGEGQSQSQANKTDGASAAGERQSKPEASKSDDSSSAGEGKSQSHASKTDGTSDKCLNGGYGTGDKRQSLLDLLNGTDEIENCLDLGKHASSQLQEISEAHPMENVRLPVFQVRDCPREIDQELIQSVRKASNGIRTRTENLLFSIGRRPVRYADTGTHVDKKRLPGLLLGNHDIFSHRAPADVQDTAIQVLIDTSISMSKKLKSAIKAALATYLAFVDIDGVKIGVAKFPARELRSYCSLQVLAGMEESKRVAMPRFKSLTAWGTTPLTEALLWAGYELEKTAAKRKIILVVTDGVPDNVATCKKVLHDIREGNTTIIGIGIECDISDVFEKRDVMKINDISDLTTSMFNVLSKALQLNDKKVR